MIQIVKSLIGSDDPELRHELSIILRDERILSSDELDVFKFMSKEYDANKQFPTLEVFLLKFPQYRSQLNEVSAFCTTDLNYYRKQFITKHENIFKAKLLHKLASEAVVTGITPDMAEAVRSNTTFEESDYNEENMSFRERYTKSMSDSSGIKTYVDQIDDEIGSITKGSVCTLAGFTGSFKCVSENERILTNRGMLTIKEIYNIGVNSDLMVQSEYGFKKLIAVHDEGYKDSYIISINGIPIETSPVHKFRVLTNDGELIWKEARYLQIGDKIVQSLKESKHTGIDDDPDFWRLYGQMCRSGGHKDDQYYLCGIYDTLDQTESESLFSKYFTKYSKTISEPRKHDHKLLFNLRAYNEYATRDELKDFIDKTSKSIVFPNKLYYLNRECWKAFIVGLYETDSDSANNNIGFTLSNKQFLVCLSRLLSSIGISSALYPQKDGNYRLYITDAISKNRFIDIVKNATFKANKNIDPIKYNNRLFPTRNQFLKVKNDKKLLLNRQDYKLFGRFGTTHSNCNFEKIKQVCKNYPVFLESDYFNEILSAELTWQPVTNIEYSSCYMYDLTVEGSPTYLLNGFVTHNTTWAVNMAVRNALAGKNIAYISLEVTKEQLEYSILSMFSNDDRFSRMGYRPIEHQRIRQNKLHEDELNFLCDVLEPEYRRVIAPNLHILDESKFKTFSESEILDALYQIDNVKKLDAVFFDHAGLFAFKSPLYNAGNVGVAINKYVSFIREISIDFRHTNGEKRSIASILLAQTNRTGFKQARQQFRKLNQISRQGNNNHNLVTQAEGYNLTALSDANELERCSSVVLTVYSDDELKLAKQAYVQLLKTRYGSNVPPTPVDLEPETYLFGTNTMVDESELSADLIDQLSTCDITKNRNIGTDIVIEDDNIYGL